MFKEAAHIAARMWMKATFDFEESRPITSRKFKPVAEVVLHHLGAEIAAGKPNYALPQAQSLLHHAEVLACCFCAATISKMAEEPEFTMTQCLLPTY